MKLYHLIVALLCTLLCNSAVAAEIEVEVIPPDAEVYLEKDSTHTYHSVGSTTFRDLQPWIYNLRVTRTGCDPHSEAVVVLEGQPLKKIIDITSEPSNYGVRPIIDEYHYEEPPEVIFCVRPEYPEFAKSAHIEGMVVLDVVILQDGSVGEITVFKSLLAGEGGLDEAAIQAVKKWRFQPGKIAGKPTDTTVRIPLEFEIANAPINTKPSLRGDIEPQKEYPMTVYSRSRSIYRRKADKKQEFILKVKVNPRDAVVDIVVDGKTIFKLWGKQTIRGKRSGVYTLVVHKRGYTAYKEELKLESGKKYHRDIKLPYVYKPVEQAIPAAYGEPDQGQNLFFLGD